MKVEISTAKLAAAVKATSMAVMRTPSAPALAGVKLTLTGDGLQLSTYDLDTSAQITVEPDLAADDGQVLLSHRLLAQVLSVASAKSCSINTEGPLATVTAGRASWQLPTMLVDDFPTVPTVASTLGDVDADELATALATVALAAGTDDALPSLTGVWLEPTASELLVVATDRYRMHTAAVALDGGHLPDGSAGLLVPGPRAIAISRLIDGRVRLRGGPADGLFGIDTGRLSITTRLLDDNNNGKWIAWQPLIDMVSRPKMTIRAVKSDLLDAMKQTMAVSEGIGATQVMLEAVDDTLTASLADTNGPGGSASIDAALTCDDEAGVRFVVNGAYLIDALTGFTGDVEITVLSVTKALGIGAAGGAPTRALQVIVNPRSEWLG